MTGIVGRDAELDVLRNFVSSVAVGASSLVLEGEAGVGKTTLWEVGAAEAEARGFRVLAARPAESETALSFSGLGDVLDTVLDEALATLPEAQKRALSRALVLDADEGPPPDPHSVGVAFMNALRALAEEGPVVIAVDDVQWLDAASSSALVYAARRLRVERVGALIAGRAPVGSALLDELRRSLGDRFTHVEVGPLDVVALQRVVHEHLGIALPRPLAAEVHQVSGGNPFYALEVVRTLRRSGVSVDAGQPLPVPKALHDLVHDRLLALPPQSRDFLLAAASYAHPTIAITEQASGVSRRVGLTPAIEAGIVRVDGARIRFTHPLLAAGAYETADPVRRPEIHARLAELLEDPEERAWQLAASVDEPDETVASVLEGGAQRARARGAPRPAAILLDRAHELTPRDEPEKALRRAADAAYLHFESGDAQRAKASLRDLIGPLAPGRLRARALLVLARIRTYDAAAEATELFLQVVEEAEGDRATLAAAHEGVASCLFWRMERLDKAVHHAQVSFALAGEIGDEALAADVLTAKLGAEALLGRATAPATADEALTLEATALGRRVLDQPLVGVCEYWMWTDSHERSRDMLVELLRRTGELGDESSRPYLLFLLGEVESMLGDLGSALSRAHEGQEAAEQSGQPLFAAYNLALQGLAQAQLGRPEQTGEAIRLALELIPEQGWQVGLVASSAVGRLELALGAPERVVTWLEPVLEFVRRESIVEPGAIPFVVDQIEALIELGRLDEAREHLTWHERNARRLERISALATCARCRGLLAAADGRVDDALAAYREALEWHSKVDLPLDRGRTLLALGVAQRRVKRRREARRTLEEALAIFERIGAVLWAERVRAELRRISGRAATPGALTPAEERVATLVAQGRSNREVAAALFVSDRTVEGHLSRVFGKLGIRHRMELAGALAARQTQGSVVSNTGDTPVSPNPSAP
jgi:DNA-binding CsgD family transcriptional regulator